MFKRIFHPRVLLLMLCGAVIGGVLFTLGDANDAPGLSFLGLAAAFLLVMRAIYHARILPRGLHLPLVLLVFGAVALAFPFILFWDGEIRLFSPVSLVSWSAGAVFVILAAVRLRRRRRL